MGGIDHEQFPERVCVTAVCGGLPSSVAIDDVWVVDLSWVFNSSSIHPVGCCPYMVRQADGDAEFRECPQHIRELAEKIPKDMFKAYCDMFWK